MSNPHSQLLSKNGPVSLCGVSITVSVAHRTSHVTIVQRYKNTEKNPIEATYLFPMEAESAVTGFSVRFADAVIKGVVKEKEEAFADYDDAMMEGNGAFLLDQERENVFTASVGNLMPDQEVEIEIQYVAQLKNEGEQIRLMIPTAVAPRYVSQADSQAPQVGMSDTERFNAPRWTSVPYGLNLSVHISNTLPLSTVESPSHPVKIKWEDSGAVVSLAQESTALDSDVVILFETKTKNTPFSMLSKGPDGKYYAMVSFLPEETALSLGGSEVVFVLDCSGSMFGPSIEEAKRALLLCLRVLNTEDSFNIVCFGSEFKSLWSESKPYTKETFAKAEAYIQSIDADLGGTEILAPLQEISSWPTDPNRNRQLVLLTDGQVSNETDVIALCRDNAEKMRIFSFGIGMGVSESLVRSLASVSHGQAEFIYPQERVEPKVLRMMNRLRSKALKNIRIDWDGIKIQQEPSTISAIFAGDFLTVFARIEELESPFSKEITLHAEENSWKIPLTDSNLCVESAIPTLWARKRIQHLEEQKGVGSQQKRQRAKKGHSKWEKEIIELGTLFGLVTRLTSCVAIEERTEENKAKEPAQLRQIPLTMMKDQRTALFQSHFFSPSQSNILYSHKSYAMSASPAVYMNMSMPSPPSPPKRKRSRNTIFELRSSADPSPSMFDSFIDTLSNMNPFRKRISQTSDSMLPAMPAPSPSPTDLLFSLILGQQSDGRFVWNDVLEGILADKASAIKKEIGHDEIRITALVVLLLQKEFGDQKDLWKDIAEKSKVFLSQNGNPDVSDLLNS